MSGSSRSRLKNLVTSLNDPAGKPVHEIVCDYEEAISLAGKMGRGEDSARLIQEYSTYFQPPAPYEIVFFCRYNTATLLWLNGDFDEAEAGYETCRELALLNSDDLSASRCVMARGVICWNRGKYHAALELMETAEKGLRQCRNSVLSTCLNWLGVICSVLSLLQRSWFYFREALELNEELGLKSNQGYVLCNLGLLCQRMNLIDQAEDCFRDSIKIQEETGSRYGLADSIANLGMLLLKKRKSYAEAEPLLEKAAAMQLENKAKSKAGQVLISHAITMYHLGNRNKSELLFERSRDLVFAGESWGEQVDYCCSRAEIALQDGDNEKAEKLLSQGIEIQKNNLPGTDSREMLWISSKLQFQKGQTREAYELLLEAVEQSRKLDMVKSGAMESVICALTEKVRGRKELEKARSESSHLKRRNATLRNSEERFKGLVNRMTNIGVLAVDSQGIVTFWNETCREFYGYREEEACGKKLSQLIVPEHLRNWFSNFIQSGLRNTEFEVNLRVLNGSIKSVLISLVPLSENETFIIQVDMTNQRRAENQRSLIEAQMRRAQKLEALGTLAGGIAHDFNNLLQGILGSAAMLCDKLEEGTVELTGARRIKNAAERSADLCTQMLDYAGVKPVSHKPIHINDVIRDISVLIETSLPKGVELIMDLSNRIPYVLGDRSQMRQVIMNLVLNGAEAISGSGEVEVFTDFVHRTRDQFKDNLLEESPDEGDYLLIQVKDSGTGIDPQTLTRIFDPFFSTKKTGRGLGLAAVLGIIRGHKGVLLVDSEPGKGTEFSVYLSAISEEPSEEADDEIETRLAAYAGRRILVVDDEEIVRETVLSILTCSGFEATAVPGGPEALELLESGVELPDLMILDLTMPGLSGVEVFKKLRNMGIPFPVLVVSGYSKDSMTSLFSGERPDGFLQKPFTPEELVSRLNRIFSRADSLPELPGNSEL
jgi:two-component system cell cycle sensor histidine kinase/response regulator CckA